MAQPRQSIRTATAASQVQQPQVYFRPDDYSALIGSKGYNIIIEKALRCPCEGETGHALVDCQNCMGTGYFFINPLKTKAIASGINRDTKYREWSAELVGTISLTVRDDGQENMSFYDKITFVDKVGDFSENLLVRSNSTGDDFVFTTYKVKSITDIFIFENSSSKLRKLTSEEYSINANNNCVIDLVITDKSVTFNGSISIRYKHEIQFNIIDLPHELRASWEMDKNGTYKLISLPMNAIARRSHLIPVERMNYDGTGWKDNSYLPKK